MATDGVKIIDGDLARDVYEQIMDLYDSDASIDLIRKEIPFIKEDYGENSDFYHEIFVTAYALAFWEIGGLTDNILDEVKRVIDLKACVKLWTEEYSEKDGQKRQKELDKLLKKITQVNEKIRKRKRYKLVKHLYFEPDDVLAFQLSDKSYRAAICAKVTQHRGQCTYDLVMTTYKGKTKPTIEELQDCFIVGGTIRAGQPLNEILLLQPYIEDIWKYTQKEKVIFGLCYILVTHKDIINFKNKFEVIGKLEIKESFKQDKSYRYESIFAEIESIFIDIEDHMRVFKEEKYPVRLLCNL